MLCCPWCGSDKNRAAHKSRFPYYCDRCGTGVYGDWAFCPWCYTDKFDWLDSTASRDSQYVGQCANQRCRGPMLPFMRYCPWCHRRRRKPWRLPQLPDSCPQCHWSVSLKDWKSCPWCGHWPLV
jgi:hypothetical protein